VIIEGNYFSHPISDGRGRTASTTVPAYAAP
jgi:hypothetical protein